MQIREAPARLFNELTRLAVGGLKAIADEDIDTSDIPEASEMFFRKAKVKYFNPTSSSMWFWGRNGSAAYSVLRCLVLFVVSILVTSSGLSSGLILISPVQDLAQLELTEAEIGNAVGYIR